MRCDCVCKATYHALPTPAQIFYCNVGNFPRNFYCCCDRHQTHIRGLAWRRASAGAQLAPAHAAPLSGPRRKQQSEVPALEGQAQHRLPSALRGLGGKQQHRSGTCQLVNRMMRGSCALCNEQPDIVRTGSAATSGGSRAAAQRGRICRPSLPRRSLRPRVRCHPTWHGVAKAVQAAVFQLRC